ncbi:unnamed protein product [Dovyalis caffra]|uniref:CCHC-type domain-containing protein n=1 Tax=Dovyalis caffra TaxID=77055 RepID=A0AAV1RF26_9ROSI|nr:unnamed protein product [Dovyalis caffra]
METEDMISLPGSSDSVDKNENDELSKSDFGLSGSHSQPGSNEAAESRDDEEKLGLHEAVGNEEGTTDGSLELNGGAGGNKESTKNWESFELNEGVIGNDEAIVDPGYSGLNVGDSGTKEAATDQSNLVPEERDIGSEDIQFAVETEADMDLVDSPVRQVNIEVVDAVIVSKKPDISSITGNVEDCFLDTQNSGLVPQDKMDGSRVKRKRTTYDEQQPSVHVKYNSLTRASKQKLEELLRQWSEWHSQQSSSSHDSDEMRQSGEDTYFPALCISMEKSSAVSFWIENQTRKQQDNEIIPQHGNSVPLYDRGYALGLTSADGPINMEGILANCLSCSKLVDWHVCGTSLDISIHGDFMIVTGAWNLYNLVLGLEIVDDAARCFNCGSYNHSLKECPKPRDNAAVNNARKQHKFKRNQNSSSRNPTRYYQSSSGGKYDGLKPGSLDTETRKLLGLGEFDPPPWLNRMRELGYPPGYLDPDDEDRPSGITIFDDGEVKEEQEDGEIMETDLPEPQRKMSVEFPGINAAIPENADQRLWDVGPSSSDPYRHRSHHRLSHSSEATGRWHHHEQRQHRDDGPPGVDSVFSPSLSSYPPRYGHYDSSYSSDSPRELTPAFGRSNSDRGRSALVYEDFASRGPSSYSSSRKRSSPRDIGSVRYETDNSWDDYDKDYSYRDHSFRSEYDYDLHRHRRSVEILEKDRNYQLQLQGWDYVNVLENQLFMKAVTEEEYINLDTLRNRLQSLILQQESDANCGQQGSNLMAMETLGSTQGCSSGAGNPIYNSYPNCGNNNYNLLVADKRDQFGFHKGIASMHSALAVASRQIASEMVCSPDINSSVTTSSCGDGFPEPGTFDNGPVFSQGDHPYRFQAFKDNFQQQHFDQS